jgi:cytochrome c oxidase subunit 2
VVALEDGSEVVADREYLRRSIIDPAADVVAGYSVAMPVMNLDDDEVDALVAYIEALG